MEKVERPAERTQVHKHGQRTHFSKIFKVKNSLPAGWWMIPGAIIGFCIWGAIAWLFLRACNFC